MDVPTSRSADSVGGDVKSMGVPRFACTMEGLGVIGTLIAAAVRCRFALSEERLAVLQ